MTKLLNKLGIVENLKLWKSIHKSLHLILYFIVKNLTFFSLKLGIRLSFITFIQYFTGGPPIHFTKVIQRNKRPRDTWVDHLVEVPSLDLDSGHDLEVLGSSPEWVRFHAQQESAWGFLSLCYSYVWCCVHTNLLPIVTLCFVPPVVTIMFLSCGF